MQRRRREAALEKDKPSRNFVRDRLAEGWSPKQISGWLRQGDERGLRAVACETICAFIYPSTKAKTRSQGPGLATLGRSLGQHLAATAGTDPK